MEHKRKLIGRGREREREGEEEREERKREVVYEGKRG